MSCEDTKDGSVPRDLRKNPRRIRKVAFDGGLLLRIASGESVVIDHPVIPQDADVVGCALNGVEVELFVESQTYEMCNCVCRMPKQRVNYTTGG